MKRSNLFVAGLVSAVLFFILPFLAYGQISSEPVMPDYTKWEKLDSRNYTAVLNGKDIELLEEFYQITDFVNLKRNSVNLIYNDANNPWLALHIEETGEKQSGGGIATKETHTYIFENKNGKWAFIEDLSSMQNISEFNNFLKNKYNLEFK
ncbi:MAG: hypothetical protein A2817_03525 [Candidatus Yanofskybacteria bacterium RIFCSPHIGHO2_01_FULL_39_8b]|uniref:Uncharacterized protein n=1 Tax=Candidatus Yanofskybacteria bacterium RIFCSPHIGHO2_01_FULL_39_8b TaxID=1802659 RepID=A0A1F8EH92_9BACT|nr:MAG: hypothetical protein A2817_03525 [Candidatus Yanofskybacteria bacterium RIFCSPHIGHO2_01_FULL_39_8b]